MLANKNQGIYLMSSYKRILIAVRQTTTRLPRELRPTLKRGYAISLAKEIYQLIGDCPGNLSAYEIDHTYPVLAAILDYHFGHQACFDKLYHPSNFQWVQKKVNRDYRYKLKQVVETSIEPLTPYEAEMAYVLGFCKGFCNASSVKAFDHIPTQRN
ncbi:hypothetical protein H6G94_03935 [Nostoc punctiforme FACHB-252]|jgi:hypothetical protein|uniref:Uncharacterized protein n=1 Tax=Nostoc punctiforme FACHB-252 TaxID=1357509 RepID=A0ABR8H5A5_NOSPU|nr:hypothetical protein [Nostoc punctiforme]MBD2610431.1 hypothetical protein [Nostoc punctiforme FACHB-252]